MTKSKTGSLLSNLLKKFRNSDGSLNWKTVAAATYATAVWTVLGTGVLAYKSGYLELQPKKDTSRKNVDRNERSRIVAEDVAENIYTSESFMG